MPKNEIAIMTDNFSGMEDFLTGLQKEQTTYGPKYAYAPLVLSLHPITYKTPIFPIDVLTALIDPVVKIPSGKIKIQEYDKNLKPSLILMDRQQALFKFINQAVWNYKNGKEQTFIKVNHLQDRIETINSAIKKVLSLLHPDQDEIGKYIVNSLEKEGAPLAQTRLGMIGTLAYCRIVQNKLEVRKKFNKHGLKKAPNKGDGWFRNLIDDLCKIWIRILLQDVKRSNYEKIIPTKSSSQWIAQGDVVKFIGCILSAAKIDKKGKPYSSASISAAVQSWQKKYRLAMLKLEKS